MTFRDTAQLRLVHYFSDHRDCTNPDRVATRARTRVPPSTSRWGSTRRSRSARFSRPRASWDPDELARLQFARHRDRSGAPANVRGGLQDTDESCLRKVRGRRPGRVRLEPNAGDAEFSATRCPTRVRRRATIFRTSGPPCRSGGPLARRRRGRAGPGRQDARAADLRRLLRFSTHLRLRPASRSASRP